ncbi:MAG TPA: DNA repair protein RecO [Candidatus Brocadiaceae bacterium]
MSILKTEAISLGRIDYSDSSQIITFYTRDYGKIRTIAKGFKRTSGKSGSKAIDLLTWYHILFIKKEHTHLYTLTEATVHDNYPMLRNNLDKFYKASCMAELIGEFTEESDPSEQLFDNFINALTGISGSNDAILWLLTFEIKMLSNLGYLPEWECCVNCKTGIHKILHVYFSAREGGILCGMCQGKLRSGIMIPAGAVLIAGRLLNIQTQRLDRVKIQLSICVEIEKMLRYYIKSLLNKELNSWKYLTV